MAKIKKIIKNSVRQLLPGNEPDFLIVGAQKAGTSSLHFYLSQHPEIIGSKPKEVRYFDREENFERGITWYKKAFIDFSKPFGKHLRFEATPDYLYRSYVPQRIFEFNPKIKIIIILRDPVKRAYSSWNMYRDFPLSRKTIPEILFSGYIKDRENNILKELYQAGKFPSFEECVLNDIKKDETGSLMEEPSFVRRGIYYPQVKKYLDLFGPINVKVIGFKDLIGQHKIETLNSILRFLGLPSSTWNFLIDEKKNFREYPEKMNENTEHMLINFYKPHNEQLFELLETKPNW